MTKNVVAGVRRTQHINRRVTQSAFRAFDFAVAEDRPLNTYVVLNLKDGPTGGATAFRLIRHKFRDWVSHKRLTKKLSAEMLKPTYVYAIESPDGHTHVNWAVHVPAALEAEFKKKLPVWVKKVQGEPRPFDLHIAPIVAKSAKRLAKYIMKGTDPLYVSHFHLQEVHKPQGEVWGRRAGISQAVGIKARKLADFHPGKRLYPMPTRAKGKAGVQRPVLSHHEVEGTEGRV